ncbi:uncharacterized protein [Ranitomeya imitator]|uniref:uncharacterized protein isoform X1 n=1 Tax=Ranitomeya imitator TaxID=111125 RepID=UPI0037E7EC76
MDRNKDTAAVAQQNMGSHHIILAQGQHSAYSQASLGGESQFPPYPLIFSTPYSQIPCGQITPSQATVVEHQDASASRSLMATGVRAPIQGAGTPALDNRQSAGIRSARRSSSSSSSSPREHRRSGRRKRERHVSKRRSYRSRSSQRSRRSRASRWRSPSSSCSSSGRSHRQESSRRRSIHRMERQGPMTPVAREASCPDTGATSGFTGTAPSGTLGGGGLPTFDLGCPGDLMPLIHSSIAPSTWKAYGKAWEEWCLLADGKPVGSSEDARMQVTMAFLSKMHAMGVSGSVARNRVSALAFHFKLRGWPDSTKHFLVSQLLKGWRRTDKHGDNRRPISFELLVSLVKAAESVCDSKYEAALTSAAFGLAFFGAMRVSEIVPTALNKPGGLRREDILICDDGLRIRICKSKTDQDGRGTWFPIFAINKGICPLTLTRNYMRFRKDGSQFFFHENGLPLVSGQFLAILRRTLSLLGLPAAEFGTHSFQIGAATEASRAGLFESEIQRVGRWRSRCFTRYIRPDLLL